MQEQKWFLNVIEELKKQRTSTPPPPPPPPSPPSAKPSHSSSVPHDDSGEDGGEPQVFDMDVDEHFVLVDENY